MIAYTSIQTNAKLNNLKNADIIFEGQQLIIKNCVEKKEGPLVESLAIENNKFTEVPETSEASEGNEVYINQKQNKVYLLGGIFSSRIDATINSRSTKFFSISQMTSLLGVERNILYTPYFIVVDAEILKYAYNISAPSAERTTISPFIGLGVSLNSFFTFKFRTSIKEYSFRNIINTTYSDILWAQRIGFDFGFSYKLKATEHIQITPFITGLYLMNSPKDNETSSAYGYTGGYAFSYLFSDYQLLFMYQYSALQTKILLSQQSVFDEKIGLGLQKIF